MSESELNILLNNILSQIRDTNASVHRLEEKQDKQTEKLNEVHSQTVKTNGRVNNHDHQLSIVIDRLKSVEKKQGRRFVLDNKILYPLAIVALLLFVIIASLLGINVKGIL